MCLCWRVGVLAIVCRRCDVGVFVSVLCLLYVDGVLVMFIAQ